MLLRSALAIQNEGAVRVRRFQHGLLSRHLMLANRSQERSLVLDRQLHVAQVLFLHLEHDIEFVESVPLQCIEQVGEAVLREEVEYFLLFLAQALLLSMENSPEF